MTLYDSSKSEKPFYSLAFASKINKALKKSKLRNGSLGFTEFLVGISE